MPEAHGGLGLEMVTSVLVEQELARAGSFSNSFGAHTGIGAWPARYFGTVEQKNSATCPALASGQLPSAYALTKRIPVQRWPRALSPRSAPTVRSGCSTVPSNSSPIQGSLTSSPCTLRWTAPEVLRVPRLRADARSINRQGRHKMGLKGSSTRTVRARERAHPASGNSWANTAAATSSRSPSLTWAV